MPVNYERVPWDKNNSLMVRLVNQRLAEVQRKASFVDSFLHAPRVCLYITTESTYAVLFCVLHPAYPVVTNMAADTTALSVPPGEAPTIFDSSIHDLFTWDRTPFQEVYYRSTDTLGMELFNRFFRGQYQDSQGRSSLLTAVGGTNGWQSTGVYSQYLEALCLFDDAVVGDRAESAWNLDTLWTNKKFLFGRSYERMPEDGNIFYSPPAEADNQEDGAETTSAFEDMSKSEEYFPKLPGYHVDYIDSLGVFAPNNWGIDAQLTHFLYEDIQKNFPHRASDMEKMVVLKQGELGNNWQENTGFSFVDLFKSVPVVGSVIGMAEGLTRYANQYRFWPRAYAFGRQYLPVLTPSQCVDFRNFYYANYQGRLKGVRINHVDQAQFQELVDLLIERDYVPEKYFPGWI